MSDESIEPFPWNGKFSARVDHLRPGYAVRVVCLACDHQSAVLTDFLRTRFLLRERLLDIPRHFRCDRCGAKGRVILYVGQAIGRGLSPESFVP
jgi:hypothetical protein